MPHFISSDGLKLHYRDAGAGPALICLAGLTRNGDDFTHVLPHLHGLRLIRPDYRGRGGSDRGDPAGYLPAVEAGDVLRLMDHLELERAAILGTSRGGLIAMVLAATAKARLAAVALNDIGPEIGAGALAHIAAYVGQRPEAQTLDGYAEILSQTPGFEAVPLARWRQEAGFRCDETAAGLTLRYDPALSQTVQDGEVAPSPDLWPLFGGFDGLPLALIRGANSDLLSAETAARMAARRPDMVFAEVPGRGHVPFLDEPEALAALATWRRLWA